MGKWYAPFISAIAVWILLSCAATSTYKIRRQAEVLYEKGQYVQSLPYFIQSIEQRGKKNSAWILKGARASLRSGDLEHAYRWLDALIKRKGYREPEAYYLMGQVLQRKHQFEDAILVYKGWLKHTDRKDPLRSAVRNYIAQCDLGTWTIRQGAVAIVSPIDSTINNQYPQFGAIPSYSTEGKIYYSSLYYPSNHPNVEHWGVYHTLEVQGKWSEPAHLTLSDNPLVSLLDIGALGKSLLYYSGNSWTGGQLSVVRYTRNEAPATIGAPEWGVDGRMGVDIFKDSIMFFASNRPGGYGGYDLYMSIYNKGHWTSPVNMGPQINTQWDEITPFLAADARTLYFSTNSPNSMGGYDVVMTQLNERTMSWSKQQNIGHPINSGSDDTHFRINKDGYRALITSDRPDGRGRQDIYAVFFNTLRNEQFYTNDPYVFAILYDELKALAPSWAKTTQYLLKKKKLEIRKRDNSKKYNLLIHPVYIKDDEYLSDPRILNFLERVAVVMRKHPKLRLEIDGYLAPKIKPWQTIYYSFQKAEIARNYLHKLGVDKDRITTRGFGDRFAIAKNTINNQPSEVGRRFNSRLEFRILGKGDFLMVEYQKPNVPQFLSVEYPETVPEGVYYKIYLQSSGQMLNTPLISNQNKAVIERINGKGKIDYLIGTFPDYASAQYGLNNLDRNRFHSLAIVPYYKGRRLNRSEIMDFVGRFPDLNNYLKENK